MTEFVFDDGRVYKLEKGGKVNAETRKALREFFERCCDVRNDGGFSWPGYLGPKGDPPKEKTKFAFKAGPGPKIFSEAPVLRGVEARPHTFRDEAKGVPSWHTGRAAPLSRPPEWLPNPPLPREIKPYAGRFRVGKAKEPKMRTAPPEPYEDAERCRREIELGLRRPQTARGVKPFSSATVPKPLFHDAPALRPMAEKEPATPRPRSVPNRPKYQNKRDTFGPYPEHIPDPEPERERPEPVRKCMVSCWTTSGVSRSIMVR